MVNTIGRYKPKHKFSAMQPKVLKSFSIKTFNLAKKSSFKNLSSRLLGMLFMNKV